MSAENKYDKQANDFLNKWGIKFTYTRLGAVTKWGMNRYAYSCLFSRKNKAGNTQEMQIDFYGSNADFTDHKRAIRPYDVLSCLSGEWQWKSANEILDEFGYSKDIDIDGILEEARKLRKFFTRPMLEELEEIR